MTTALLNFSGHALSDEAIRELATRFDVLEDAPIIDIDFSSNVELQLKDVIRRIRVPLNGSVSISIVPPGQSTISILLFIFLHGLLGHFPSICLLQHKVPGIYVPESIFHIEGTRLRNTGRKFRQELWQPASKN